MADAAAAESALGPKIDGMAYHVITRLACAAQAWSDFTRQIPEFLAEAGAVFEVEEVKEPRKAVREAWAQSSHDIHHVGQVLRCKKCMTGVARSKPQGGTDHAL